MKYIDYVLIALLLLLGIAHTALTPFFYKEFNEEFIWFAGTGLAFVFLSFLNISRVISRLIKIGIISIISNILGLTLVLCLLSASKSVGIQGYISLLVLLLILNSSVRSTFLLWKLEPVAGGDRAR